MKPTKSEEELDKVGQDRAIDVAAPGDNQDKVDGENGDAENDKGKFLMQRRRIVIVKTTLVLNHL